MKRSSYLALAAAAIGLAAVPVAQASIVFVAPTAATPGSMTITAPISFTLSSSVPTAATFFFILQSFVVTADATQSTSTITPNVAFTINGNPAVYGGNPSVFQDNLATAAGDVVANDGYIAAPAIANGAGVGNIVTLAAGTYTLSATPGFNPLATQTFNGNMFITNTTGHRISNIVAAGIPEPSTWAFALSGAGLLGVVARRRRGARD